jgi:hypothetical protein
MVKVLDVKMTKALRDQPHGKKGRKLALGNKDFPSGVHEKDRWQKCFIPTFLDWVGRQADPWNLPDDKVINALQKIWNVVYKRIPYTVEQKDAVCAVVRMDFCYVSDAYKSYRPNNVPATQGVL